MTSKPLLQTAESPPEVVEEAPTEHPHPPHPWDPAAAAILLMVHLGCLLAPFTFSWSGLGVCILLYWLTAMGVTLGYHRLLTHRSFKTFRPLEYFITFWALQACQGGPATWAAVHRLHHKHSDEEGDPHGADVGFWWSHLGWMLVRPPCATDPSIKSRMAPDLLKDPVYRFADKYYLALVILFGVFLLSVGGLSWLVYGMFLRLTLVYHATWLVNSASHKYGYRSYPTNDLSTNCWWVALVSFGEGWHNNHHAFPHSARHGLRWWEFDATYAAILLMERVGLAWNVRRPKPGVTAAPSIGEPTG
ncbi:MAG: acyl-CoA desaturase [Vulcanimicrobiota bacterium]